MHFGNRKSVGVIGSVGVPAKYGGFETLAEHLVKMLSDKIELHVVCSAPSYTSKLSQYHGAKLHYVPLSANGVQSIPYDIWSILKVSRHCDTLLVLGVASGFFLPLYRMFSKKRIVLNVDGLEWKREKWGKLARWYLRNAERLAVKSADLVIADNKVIQKHLLESYGRQSTLIAYGADHVLKIPLSDEIKREFTFLNKPYAFKVCRIEPENNVEMILQAFAQIEDLPLVIIGNWNSSEFGLNLREKYIQPHLHLLDPIYDQQLLDQIRSNCLVYIHGHSAGGTNPSLVEAMYLSLPILAFDVQYNRETTENKALSYFKNTSDLKQSIQVLNEKTCVESGNEMKAIAEARYTWKIITDKYKSIF